MKQGPLTCPSPVQLGELLCGVQVRAALGPHSHRLICQPRLELGGESQQTKGVGLGVGWVEHWCLLPVSPNVILCKTAACPQLATSCNFQTCLSGLQY